MIQGQNQVNQSPATETNEQKGEHSPYSQKIKKRELILTRPPGKSSPTSNTRIQGDRN